MKKRLVRMAAAVGLGLLVLAGGVWALCRNLGDRPRLYQGKTVFEWSQTAAGKDPAASRTALEVLDREIIPHLTRTILEDTNDSRLRFQLIELMNTLPGVDIYAVSAPTRRAGAADRLGDFGPAAAAAIPVLRRAFEGPDKVVRGPAAVALARMHAAPGELIPQIITALDEEDLREAAARALGKYGSEATSAVPKLQVLFRVPDKDLHHEVVEALRAIDPSAMPQGGMGRRAASGGATAPEAPGKPAAPAAPEGAKTPSPL